MAVCWRQSEQECSESFGSRDPASAQLQGGCGARGSGLCIRIRYEADSCKRSNVKDLARADYVAQLSTAMMNTYAIPEIISQCGMRGYIGEVAGGCADCLGCSADSTLLATSTSER